MPLGASRINGISKVIVVAAATVVRRKNGIQLFGNAQVDTGQSKFGGASLQLDGTGDYIQVPYSSSLATWNAADGYTIEYWIRLSSLTGLSYPDGAAAELPVAFGNHNPLNNVNYWSFGPIDDGSVVFFYYTGSKVVVQTSGVTLSTNTWYHLAMVYSGGTIKIYVDGTERASASVSGTPQFSSGIPMTHGAAGETTNYINGWTDEMRVSNTARYTAAFTPSTSAFVNDDYTIMLLHMNGTDASTFIEDDNGIRASRDLRAIGNAQIDTAQSKFGGASYLGDGTGDYLISNANSAYDFGTGSFTIEFWVRFASVGTLYVPTALREGAGIENGNWWCEVTATEKKMYWGFKNQAGTQYYVNLALAGTAFVANQWYHIALVNNAGTAQMYIDGTATGVTTSLSGSFGTNGTQLWIGAGAGAYSTNGHIDEYRISNTARYTANFTPSTTPFTNDDNTRILVHFNGTDASTVFRDDNGDGRTPKDFRAIGNAQIDTAQSKFGGAAALFDGNGDYLTIPYQSDFAFTGDFTIEFWWYQPSNVAAGIYPTFVAMGVLSEDGGWEVTTEPTTNKVSFITSPNGSSGMTVLATTNSITAAAWHHIAVVRSSSVIKIYVDGTQSGSTYTTTGNPKTTAGDVYIGGGLGGLSSGTFSSTSATVVNLNGSLDELRISNSARYTADFTAPTAAFQNDANTLLLLHFDGTDGSTVFIDDNGDRQV